MSIAKFARHYAGKGAKLPTKYGSERISHAGLSFMSKLEAAVYDILYLYQKAGDITNLQTQKRVYFLKDPDIYYIPDFYFERNGVAWYAEAKGFETDIWKIKKKLWVHFGQGPLEIYGGSYQRPKMLEVLHSRAQHGREET